MSQSIIEFLKASSPILIAIYLLWKELSSGNSAVAKKIREDYKERNTQLETMCEELKKSNTNQTVNIAKLEGIIQEKDKQLDRYEKIFANRNPDLTDVLGEIKTFMKNIYEQNKYQTGILEKRQIRDKEIDRASAGHKGSIMRSPVQPENPAPDKPSITLAVTTN